jgi:hypothetical protein
VPPEVRRLIPQQSPKVPVLWLEYPVEESVHRSLVETAESAKQSL